MVVKLDYLSSWMGQGVPNGEGRPRLIYLGSSLVEVEAKVRRFVWAFNHTIIFPKAQIGHCMLDHWIENVGFDLGLILILGWGWGPSTYFGSKFHYSFSWASFHRLFLFPYLILNKLCAYYWFFGLRLTNPIFLLDVLGLHSLRLRLC